MNKIRTNSKICNATLIFCNSSFQIFPYSSIEVKNEYKLNREEAMKEQLKSAIENRLRELQKEEEQLTALLNSYGIQLNGEVNKTERTRNLIRKMMEAPKSYHINDIKHRFDMDGMEFNKALVHQALATLYEAGEVIKVRINGSNKKYFYMSSKAKNGGEYKIKDLYLPMPKKYIESIEIM